MSGTKAARGATKRPKTARESRASKRSPLPANESHVCQVPGCGKACRSLRGLDLHRRAAHPPPAEPVAPESPTAAVERALQSFEVTPKRAVLAATVRELARALEDCLPTDKAKTSRELTVRMNELLAEARPDADDDDWTKGTSSP